MKGDLPERASQSQPPRRRESFTVPNFVWQFLIVLELLYLLYPTLSSLPGINHFLPPVKQHPIHGHPANCHGSSPSSPFGRFPQADDPFRFIPCTGTSLPPALDDPKPDASWMKLFDPNPNHWSWGNRTATSITAEQQNDPFAGRGIYMCGYLDVPLDYTNKSDPRIARLAVTKFQVTGLSSDHNTKKTERTVVINPGGPGGSGTSYAWRAAEEITERLSGGRYDVLGFDPRGVNASLPTVSCSPHDADRDRWSLEWQKYRAAADSNTKQLHLMDAFHNATLRACWERQGDLARFVSTAFVARDVEEIRKALGEDELTGFMVSYGTGIGQTYANMFPNSVGRLILDGTEYVRDHRLAGGFGFTALDNVTNAWHDGFLGECLKAGPEHCALAKTESGESRTLTELDIWMQGVIGSLASQPLPAYTEKSGPSLVTYSVLVSAIYQSMYNPHSWKALAEMLYELGQGNTTLAGEFLDANWWQYDPSLPCPAANKKTSADDLTLLVVCSDAYDGDYHDLRWWSHLWEDMTRKSWIAGDSRFFVFACRHFATYWPKPAEVYRGDLNHTLRNPVLLVAETYDPATPLRNGRRLAAEMGVENARLIAHHGYGHSSGRDRSACTDGYLKAYMLDGALPAGQETACYADEKPYLYGVKKDAPGSLAAAAAGARGFDPVASWREHLRETRLLGPPRV
ncbi:hypothetical protein PG999_007677 [Apiospora kogelbergensis]|uniref:AB hydrolase-1 domain-containing protein n=1 Tax=Apiospora kogelbergensis TaxID=1337665 RepID=A0AAW0QVL8_9PEZI